MQKIRHLYPIAGSAFAAFFPGITGETRGIIVGAIVVTAVAGEALIEGVKQHGIRGEISYLTKRAIELEKVK